VLHPSHPCIPLNTFFQCKLLDVFSSKTNLNLVLEFLDSDLEMIIKDRSLVFLPADIKSWMAMTFRGLEFCHRNFVLHRVSTAIIVSIHAHRQTLNESGSETQQLAHCFKWCAQNCRFWSCKRLRRPRIQNDLPSNHSVSRSQDCLKFHPY
jgi:hypothetical protein